MSLTIHQKPSSLSTNARRRAQSKHARTIRINMINITYVVYIYTTLQRVKFTTLTFTPSLSPFAIHSKISTTFISSSSVDPHIFSTVAQITHSHPAHPHILRTWPTTPATASAALAAQPASSPTLHSQRHLQQQQERVAAAPVPYAQTPSNTTRPRLYQLKLSSPPSRLHITPFYLRSRVRSRVR